LFLALGLALAQDVPPPVDTGEDIVVSATVGKIALVFDKGVDGRLHNCRVFLSSGVRRLDAKACASLPDCVTIEGGETFCGDKIQGRTAAVPKPDVIQAPGLAIGSILKPEAKPLPATGPALRESETQSADRLGKLPPPPRPVSGGPGIQVGPVTTNQRPDDRLNPLGRSEIPSADDR
jgi:hypothetical protein